MTFKNHELTWQFDVNQEIYSTNSDGHNDIFFLALKNSLIGFASNPWIVKGSSNSVSAGMDGVDRWVTTANIVNSTAVHSWIVLEQTGLGTNFQLLISFPTNSGLSVGTIVVSPNAGFTGGTTGDNPTATDQVILANGTDIGGSSSLSLANDDTEGSALHVMQTEDGYCTRITATRNTTGEASGKACMYWAFERSKNPTNNWTNPYFCTVSGVSSVTASTYGYGDFLNFTNSAGSTPSVFRTWQNSTSLQLYYTVEGISSNFLVYYLQSKNDISGEYELFPCGLFSSTHGFRGRVGETYDFYLGAINSNLYYFSDESGTERQWIQLGNMVLPWDGSFITLG